MDFYDVKFSLNLNVYDYSVIGNVFNKAKGILNWRFNENFKASLIDKDIDYEIRDISNLETSEIDKANDESVQ